MQLTDDANPCGLIAKYQFNDWFELWEGTNNITIDDTNIAHSVDIDYKFKKPTNGDDF